MKVVKAGVKTFTIAMGLVSLVAMAESFYDSSFYTSDFMDTVAEVKVNLPRAKEDNRIVASKQKNLPLIQRVDLNNADLVNGKWIITKVVDDQENIAYESKNEVNSERVVVNLELIDISTVRVDDDYGQTFKISLLTREGTIALFKEFGAGFEIVQAVRVREDELAKEEKVNRPIREVKENKNAMKYHINEDLLLVSALDPSKNRNVLRADNLEGYAYLKNGELIIESVRLHVGTSLQTESLSMEARIKDHGVFSDVHGSQGIVTNVNNDEVKVRFSTGPLAGAMLNFVTERKKVEIEGKFGTRTERPVKVAAETQVPATPVQEYHQEGIAPLGDNYQADDYKENEEVREEYYDDPGFYEEAQGLRENSADFIEVDEYEAERFEELRNDQRPRYSDRNPASIKEIGFSF